MTRCRSTTRFAGTWHTRCTREGIPVHIRHEGPGRTPGTTIRWTEACPVAYLSDINLPTAWEVPAP